MQLDNGKKLDDFRPLTKVISQTKRMLRSSQYGSGLISFILNPFSFARQSIFVAVKKYSHLLEGEVLDVGCGKAPYSRQFFPGRWEGLEMDTPENRASGIATHFYTGGEFPFADSSYDGVIATQVLEHVFDPDRFLSECHRVLKPGGKLLLTVPFAWLEHEQPHDYGRYSSFGIKHLFLKHRFKTVVFEKLTLGKRALTQLLIADLFEPIKNSPRWIKVLFLGFVAVPLKLLGLLLSAGTKDNGAFYLDNFLVATRSE